ncbi:unnamed protein product [Phaedon cochleariae]|uniref:Uncharacterized protein n=1 Tax=Phaedon cochleariae TaxID=80249 RepID=A0A9N9X5U1_PHACE|nr:unnamed protein product [Phaedon cochleariae]
MAEPYRRYFSDEYYNCTVNLPRASIDRWFCNRAVSPNLQENENNVLVELQNATISSSDNSSVLKDSEVEVSNIMELGNKETEVPESEEENDIEDHDDSVKDPNYELSETSSEEEINSDVEEIPRDEIESDMLNEDPPIRNRSCMNYESKDKIKKGNKGKDFCFHCDSLVLNFARHIKRNHSTELDVQKIFSKPPRSKERKELLSKLRKKGNYLNSNIYRKPVKTPSINTNILPCNNCLGFYSAKQLWRHKKKCCGTGSKACQSEAQHFHLKNSKIDKQLIESVFPRMRADEVSLQAKEDPLICAYGARYMKIHREKHFVNVTSRKMRELAKLLMEAKKEEPSINNLFEALQPKYFDLLVAATKIVAKYDKDKDCYKSPTFALNIGTTLKQCCKIAIVFALKRKEVYATLQSAEAEANLKTMIQLIESHWRFDVSSQAANDLNMNKWNKVTLVPLATDLKHLKDFLIKTANSAAEALSNGNKDRNSYVTLLETVFCRVMLLNRRRPGELQRLLLEIYENSGNISQNYEEFTEAVTPSEKILMQKFKRIVIRGKRGRGVPVLFSPDVQQHIKIMLNHRPDFVAKGNTYLFGNPKTMEPICGYKVLKKYAEACGAKNPQAISSTRLRKHLATLTQIFSMSEGDIEQLASFMGHTVGVHKGSYRLPDDVYQTAKISKLLLLMGKGSAAEFKGKPLNEIELDLEDDLMNNDEKDDGATDAINVSTEPLSRTVSDHSEMNILPKTNKRILIPWTDKQKEAVNSFFAEHINKKQPPKKHECEAVKCQNPNLLENKSWLKIKVYVQNEYMKKKRK